MERLLTATLVLVCFGQNFVWAKTEDKYFVLNKTLELRPPSGVSTINSIIWRHKDSLVAEWAKGDKNVTIYANFKDRATLNTNNGYLVISSMRETDAGEYSVEINDNLLEDGYKATAIQEVPEPTVWVSPDREDFMLLCEGDVENARPVTYMWNTREDGEWVELDQKVQIAKNEIMQRVKTLSCKMVNSVSEKESKPEKNPWYKKEESHNSVLWALVLLPIAVLITLGVAAYCYRHTLRPKLDARF